MNLSKCICDNGNINITQLFVQKFGKIPSTFGLTFNEDEKFVDVNKITNELINNIFSNVDFIRRHTNKYTFVSSVVDESEHLLNTSESGTFIQIVTHDFRIYIVDYNSITVRYVDESENIVEDCLLKIWNLFPKKERESREATVNLVGYSDGNYYTIESRIKKVDININENYNDDFIPVYKDLVDFLDSRESGLVLLYGKVGSGKSNFLRHLCNKYNKDYIIVPTSLTNRLGDPDFISFMLDNTNSIFILEDCEQVLMDRGVNMFNGAISNILNMSDGLLSDIMNIKFICTFNADINTIDKALLRKGRCYAKYEFKPLCEDKVRYLNDKYNLGITNIKPMTLAEIYNANKTEYSDNKTNKIGF